MRHSRHCFFLGAVIFLCPAIVVGQFQRGYEVKKLDVGGNGIVEVHGMHLRGYTYGPSDTINRDMITAITEYKNNKINGRRIQFFKFPDDTASVEFFRNDTLHGPFYYNHPNGKVWVRGMYAAGVYNGQPEYWGEDGHKINENIVYDEESESHYIDGKLCQGKLSIYGYGGLSNGKVTHDVWFTSGKIDSVYSYTWAYWGKASEIRSNYHDSSRVYWNFSPKGLPMCRYSGKMMTISSKRIYKEWGHLVIKDVDKIFMDGKQINYHLGTTVISDESYYDNGEKVGEWKFYDLNGQVIRTEKH